MNNVLLLIFTDQLITWAIGHFLPAMVIKRERYFSFASPFVFWILTSLILFIIWRYFSGKNQLGIFLITAGAFSNFISFQVYGHFIDYIPTGLSYINTADILIGVGCIVCAKEILTSEKRLQTSR